MTIQMVRFFMLQAGFEDSRCAWNWIIEWKQMAFDRLMLSRLHSYIKNIVYSGQIVDVGAWAPWLDTIIKMVGRGVNN
jgi:hypothetical protein